MNGRISIYTIDLQLNPPNGIIEPAIMLQTDEDGYLFVVRGLYVYSSVDATDVKISNKEFIVNITI